jgi:cobalt-precorrin-5B (C1)-methyltransferase
VDLHAAPTVEAALAGLEAADAERAERLRRRLAATIEDRSRDYLANHGESGMAVGAVLFDRGRRIRAAGPVGGPLLEALGGAP